MSHAELQSKIDHAWEDRENISTETTGDVRDAVKRCAECARLRSGSSCGKRQ